MAVAAALSPCESRRSRRSARGARAGGPLASLTVLWSSVVGQHRARAQALLTAWSTVWSLYLLQFSSLVSITGA
jgi:hypothetical protein